MSVHLNDADFFHVTCNTCLKVFWHPQEPDWDEKSKAWPPEAKDGKVFSHMMPGYCGDCQKKRVSVPSGEGSGL